MPTLYGNPYLSPALLELARQSIRNYPEWGDLLLSSVHKPKLTVCEKVKLMWERSKWGKEHKFTKFMPLSEKKKVKPYYRRHERW